MGVTRGFYARASDVWEQKHRESVSANELETLIYVFRRCVNDVLNSHNSPPAPVAAFHEYTVVGRVLWALFLSPLLCLSACRRLESSPQAEKQQHTVCLLGWLGYLHCVQSTGDLLNNLTGSLPSGQASLFSKCNLLQSTDHLLKIRFPSKSNSYELLITFISFYFIFYIFYWRSKHHST